MRHRAPRPLIYLIPCRLRLAVLAALTLVGLGLGLDLAATGLRSGPPKDGAASRAGTEGQSGDLPLSAEEPEPELAPDPPSPGSPRTLSAKPSEAERQGAVSDSPDHPDRQAREPVPNPTSPTSSPTSPGPSPTGAARTKPAEDDGPPETTAWTVSSTRDSWEVRFSADEEAEFECSLDGADFAPCSSPAQFTDLRPGKHRLSVRAVDRSSTPDPTPVELVWHSNGTGSGNQP